MTVIETIKQQIADNPILIYMKGLPNAPSCGFSARAVKILSSYVQNFSYIDVLNNPDIRMELPKFANWPTFPQIWIKGNLIGGYDILLELHKNGKLKLVLEDFITN